MSERRTLDLEFVPVQSRPSFYAAMLGGRVLCRSRQPLLDAARVLLAEGIAPKTVITARHVGSAIVAMRSTVGEAAKWRIEESDRGGLKKRRWAPFETARLSAQGAPENAGGELAGMEVPASTLGALRGAQEAAAP